MKVLKKYTLFNGEVEFMGSAWNFLLNFNLTSSVYENQGT